MPPLNFENAFQVLILAGGIYLVLGLLRTARGSSLVRGLGIATLVGGVGLYVLVKLFDLHELERVLQAIFGVAFIVLAILFQPELRRGILSLGDHKVMRRLLGQDSAETVAEVAAAAVSMAKKRQGALIAFERKTPLDAVVDKAAHIDAPVSRELLESLFYPGSPLHDGAVILRGDRVASAAALFPLSDNADLSQSTGTRHRAALGLSEQTDAVAVVVSEETGAISIAKGGELERRINRDDFEEILRDRLGEHGLAGESGSHPWVDLLLAHWGQKLVALAMGLAVFLIAYQQVNGRGTYKLRVAAPTAANSTNPVPGTLVIVPPPERGDGSPIVRVMGPAIDGELSIEVVGPREQISQLDSGAGGLLVLDDATATNRELSTSEFRWGAGLTLDDVEVTWLTRSKKAPRLEVGSFVERLGSVSTESLRIELNEELDPTRGELGERWIHPVTPRVLVPVGQTGPVALEFEPVRIDRLPDGDYWSGELALSRDLAQEGLELREPVWVTVRIVRSLLDLSSINRDVALVWMNPAEPDRSSALKPPDRKVRLRVRISDLRDVPIGTSRR